MSWRRCASALVKDRLYLVLNHLSRLEKCPDVSLEIWNSRYRQNKIQMLKPSGTAVSRSPGWYKRSAYICVRGIWWDTSLIISVTYSHWLFTDVCGGSSLQNFYIFCGNANNCRCSEPYRLFTSSSTSLFSDCVGALKLLLLPPGVLQPSGAVCNSLRQRVNPTGDCNHI